MMRKFYRSSLWLTGQRIESEFSPPVKKKGNNTKFPQFFTIKRPQRPPGTNPYLYSKFSVVTKNFRVVCDGFAYRVNASASARKNVLVRFSARQRRAAQIKSGIR
ncbi:hypothetical protein DQ04_11421000 [Trypanosoma grayi]|uniref:hypothetical protein n=1 Tax=Trypanosoma grayi TaxID=71804 RepID=UPI0004F420A3|nr:hypothetical protein DQ04_11421000 [Trypanosoma grayi]KEG06974.1 hypothetical protein DQ04_11421000 [Trypanosoma grayi]